MFELVSVAEQAGLNLTLSETPKTGFLAQGTNEINIQTAFFNRCKMFNNHLH